MNYIGEIAALLTAIFWTVTSFAFENASLKIGSLPVNIIRLFMAFIFLSIFTFFYRGLLFPTDATAENWLWLILSGLVGFVFGDLCLFKSYTIIGSRFAMLIMTLAPPIAAISGWIFLKERLSLLNWLGMLLTLGGISLAIFNRNHHDGKIGLKLSTKGLLFAFGGAIGQALGLVLSKIGMKGYDPFASTQIRIIAGIAGFSILVAIMGRWKSVVQSVSNKSAMISTGIGSFFGPFLGVSFSLFSITKTEVGIASTIMAIVPILIIPPAILIYKQKVTTMEIIGALISVIGVSLFFINF